MSLLSLPFRLAWAGFRRPMQAVVIVVVVSVAVEPLVHPGQASSHLEVGQQPARPAPAAVTGLAGVPGASVTPAAWAQALLGALGDQGSDANLRAVTAWERAEGGHWQNTARYNPLNTTQPEPGSWAMNGVGVQAYTSWDEGLTATVTTLRNGRYGAVLAALRRGDCASCVAATVAASPWGTGWFAT